MTVRELLEEPYIKGKYNLYEIYKYCGKIHKIHTDFIKFLNDTDNIGFISLDKLNDMNVCDYQLMNEEEYNNTIDANCDNADFEEWYGSKDAVVLVIILNENEVI